MDGRANAFTKRWQDPVRPLYVALLFQAVVLVLVVVVEEPFAAPALVGGTIGCLVASLRLQKQQPATSSSSE